MSQLNQHQDRDGRGRLLRGKYRGDSRFPHFPNGDPWWWRHLFHIIPLRRANCRCEHCALYAVDFDGLLGPVKRTPRQYFW